ncbi:hypothetical protein DTO164E3_4479 [Paecilomyces variotii]|uniref:Dienelactone hydrolase n=1 Tax=Byssochlamys spectabilis TaxID=264951 RepID=A0A443HHR3_BYSSP|nr:dienelactone hydrolase [Paecilomyces variotii]KAJ9199594.1 hypothetical protein DTO164E3_4479 [Paecilomyces variotii]KAJ9203312.1 hypothetical protein DTO032I3_3179 [Paecilomyces variotii]KAJ9246879.1 hypothetical protein DTO207G8_8554 [Paecilomyces variotii]KAJ9278951.1 hypothetical protein DTO021D3_4267 [Paecilomyces variotii]KAJ9343228.1 hypothetical protein DTO027B6_4152 [Paecilomyces variotii]
MDKIVPNTIRRTGSNLGHRLRTAQSTYPEKDTSPARLVITAETPRFDPYILRLFKNEGFHVSYMPFKGNKKEYDSRLQQIADDLEQGERYAIVAYGEAAARVLEACTEPMPKLCAAVAYYPTTVPANVTFPPSLQVAIHLAGSQNFGTKANYSYTYPDTEIGFAEHRTGDDRDVYNKVSTRLAWSRTLGCLRKGFNIEHSVEMEELWERHLLQAFSRKDADRTMATMYDDGDSNDDDQLHVNHVPTMVGGTGYHDLHEFYSHEFIPHSPPSLKLHLLSRTVGTDRIVDELLLTFRHTQEIPWLLPRVPPTDREVQIVIVIVVTLRGNKLARENIYWDQASVLMQIGLLDPTLVPQSFKATGKNLDGKETVDRLPVTGAEAAWMVVDEQSEDSNKLLDE